MRLSLGRFTQKTAKWRKFMFAGVVTLVLVGGTLVYQNIINRPQVAKAITPPDSCFQFNSATGTITNY